MQAELNRWRVRRRIALLAEGVEDLDAAEARELAGVGDLRSEVRACWVVIDQHWVIRLLAVVPRGGTLQGETGYDTGDQRGLGTPDEEVLAVGVEEDVADHARVEERDLHVVPGVAVQST